MTTLPQYCAPTKQTSSSSSVNTWIDGCDVFVFIISNTHQPTNQRPIVSPSIEQPATTTHLKIIKLHTNHANASVSSIKNGEFTPNNHLSQSLSPTLVPLSLSTQESRNTLNAFKVTFYYRKRVTTATVTNFLSIWQSLNVYSTQQPPYLL